MRWRIRPRNHWRIFLGLAIGVLVWILTFPLAHPLRLVLAGDGFFISYLAAIATTVGSITPDRLRDRAAEQDEGVPVIFAITAGVVGLSITSIFVLLSQTDAALHVLLAIVSVILGWFTFHTVMASHYAHRYYKHVDHGGTKRKDAGGLDIPGAKEPVWGDFLYHALVIGMTSQVADIDITTPGMRRLVMAHSTVAFFFNTVILALAINVAAGQAH